MISSFGNWGYTYGVHRKYGNLTRKTARDILNERYALGELSREEFRKMRIEISENSQQVDPSDLTYKPLTTTV